MRRVRVLRFQQGDLDGLCGAYAVVHSILVAAANRRPRRMEPGPPLPTVGLDEVRGVFAHLMRSLVRKSLADPIINGITPSSMLRLLEAASLWLSRRVGFKIAVSRPYRPSQRPRRASLLKVLQEHLECHGCTAIIGTRLPWNHWTVVRRVGRKRLVIVDSGGSFYVPLCPGKTTPPAHAGLIEPNCLFLLTLNPTRSRTRQMRKPKR
jgi:hypothetical protein